MGFIIRSVFWLSLVLLLIPFGGQAENGQPLVNPLQAMFAAKAAIEDVSGMCERKPEVCSVGKAAFHTIGVRARDGARIAYEALDGYGGAASTAPDNDPIAERIAQAASDETITGTVAETR